MKLSLPRLSFGPNNASHNEYGVIPVLFHTDCNMVGEHGTIRVSNVKRGLKQAIVSFHLKNCAEVPAFTPKLFLDLEAAAESQGYVLHELISYVRLTKSEGHAPMRSTDHDRHNLTHPGHEVLFPNQTREDTEAAFRRTQVPIGSLHHSEFGSAEGTELLHRMGTIPKVGHREPFDMRRMARVEMENLHIPAFLRKQAGAMPEDAPRPAVAKMEAAIALLIKQDPRAWVLDPAQVELRFGHLSSEQRQEIASAAYLIAARKVTDSTKREELCSDLVKLVENAEKLENDEVVK